MEAFNRLTPAEAERLDVLQEELAEAIVAIGKIKRHGWESRDPTNPDSPTNRHALEIELGDVHAAAELMIHSRDIETAAIARRVRPKLRQLQRYVHHNWDAIERLLDPAGAERRREGAPR